MPKTNIRANPGKFAVGCAMGAAVTVVLSIILLTIPAALIASGRVGEEAAMSFAVVCAFISSCAGALTARVKNKGAALISGLGASAMAVLVRLLIMLTSDVSTSLDGGDLGVCLAMLAGGALTGAVTGGHRRRRR